MTHIEDTERSVTEIEMLKVVLFLVSMRRRAGDREGEEKGESGNGDCSDHVWMQ
jgi:hypothetical protein